MAQIASNSIYVNAPSSTYGSNAFVYEVEIIEGAQSVENNTTAITVNFYIRSVRSTFYEWTDTDATFTISSNNGQSFNNNSAIRNAQPYLATLGSRVLVSSWTGTFNNKTDGTLSVSASVTYGWDYRADYLPITTTISTSGNTTTIPRATTPVMASSANMGSALSITLNRASSTFTHTLEYSFEGATGTIGTNLGTNATWNIPLALANRIPSATSGTCSITCKTYNGSTLIGTKSVTITLNVPANVVPTISAVAVTEVGANIGVFVQGQSQANVSITASGANGSTISAYASLFDNVTYTGSSFTTGTIYTSGSKTLTVTVTDSRGRTATTTQTVTVYAYTPPNIQSFSAFRCNVSGVAQEDGIYAKILYKYTTSALGNQNQISLTVKCGSTIFINQSPVAYTADTFYLTGAIFEVEHSYNLEMILADEFVTNTAQFTLPTDTTIFDILNDGKGIAFGKVAEDTGYLDCGFKAKFRDDVEFADDEDWTALTLESGWVAYNNDSDNTPKYRISGKVCEVRGQISPVTAHASSNTRETFATLPNDARPSDDIYVVCQGSGKNTWLFSIQPTGAMTFSRYGISSNDTVPTSAWLVFQATFLIE